MKRVLILAYDFPPYVSVGGLRPYSWYKYFREFDIDPIVVTRQWSNKHGNHLDYIVSSDEQTCSIVENNVQGTIIRTPYKANLSNRLLIKYGADRFSFLRKAITFYHEFSPFISKGGTKSALYYEAQKYLKANKVDAIIATGEPFVLFTYAASLSKTFDIPWIADYRDSWTHEVSRSPNWLMRKWNAFIEKKILKNAACATTVSEFLKYKITDLIHDKVFHVLPNGYDPEAIECVEGIRQQSEKLRIVFVGTIYEWNPIRSFFKVFSKFITEHSTSPMEIHFYGINIADKLEAMLDNEFKLIYDKVKIIPKVPNPILLQKIAESNVMLLFNYYSHMGTKIFDYLAIKRKIVMCYTDDPEANKLKEKYFNVDESDNYSRHLQEDLIKATNSGVIVKDSVHLMKVLTDLEAEFNQKGMIECNSIGIERYSRKIQVEKLAEIIRQII